MSVDFYIATATEFHATGLNMGNVNAADLLGWLDFDPDPWSGERVKASELAARCRRRLWDVARNHDPALAPVDEGRYHFMGRRPDYLREKAGELLKICERALQLSEDALVYWG